MSPDELKKYIDIFLESNLRKNMYDGEKYYICQNDILSRKFTFYNIQLEEETDKERSNQKIPSNFLKTIVDQLVSYCFSKDLIIGSESSIDINENIDEVSEESALKSVGWLHVYPDENGDLQSKVCESENIIEIRDGSFSNKLVYIIRLYLLNDVQYAEVWDNELKSTYMQKDDGLYELIDESTHMDNNMSWGMIPFVPFYYDRFGTTALTPIKILVDVYDLTISDFANNFIDFQELILFVKNYAENVSTAQAASEIMTWLKKYKIINVKEDGSIDILSREVPYQARGEFLTIIKKLIFTFGQSVDIDDLKGSSLTNVVIKAHFSLLDIKANRFIKQAKKYIKMVLQLSNRWNELKGVGQKIDLSKLDITFNKSLIINEKEVIDSVVASDGVISRETNIKNHPWVDDYKKELELIEEDEINYQESNIVNNEENDIDFGGDS